MCVCARTGYLVVLVMALHSDMYTALWLSVAQRRLQQKHTIMDHVSVVAFWRSMLAKQGFGGGAAREERLAKFIAKNLITKVEHLEYADHPSEWMDAEGITPDELQAVWNLRGVVRQRSRLVLSNLIKALGGLRVLFAGRHQREGLPVP